MDGEDARIDDPLPDFIRDTGESNASKSPVGEEEDLPGRGFLWRQVVPEGSVSGDIEPDPAVRTGEETIRLLKGYRGATLRALVFNLP